ncbi:hypothetical protein [Streptomyces nojiriensis]|uniref:hypothetical protein n=1 Tax=Streptomyces nojiriensis TaxID=66374 RepID=UPI0036534F45
MEARHPARARPSSERAPCAGGLLESVRRRPYPVADQGRGVRGGHRREVAERGDIPGATGSSGTAQERGRLPDPRQGQAVGERRTGEPHRTGTAVRTVPGQRDRIADQSAVIAVALAHAQCGVAPRERGRGPDGALQHLPGRLSEAAAHGLLRLPGDRTPTRGPVER